MTAEQIIESSPYYDSDSYDALKVDRQSSYYVSSCQACSFVFTSDTPSEKFLDALYSPGDIAESIEVFARPSRAAYAFRSLATLLEAIDSRKIRGDKGISGRAISVLDVGCAFGVGSLGLTCAHFPYEVSGVEWSAKTREYLDSEGMTTYRSLEEIPTNLTFDGILLNDVLEHVPDPVGFLKALYPLCDTDTVVWVNVPNFIDWRMEWISKMVSEQSLNVPKDFNPWEHLSYFSPETLDLAMSKIGAARLHSEQVSYPIDRTTLGSLAKSVFRLVRDLPTMYRKQYPNNTSTSGIFEFKKLASDRQTMT